jgi:hypothetical protein
VRWAVVWLRDLAERKAAAPVSAAAAPVPAAEVTDRLRAELERSERSLALVRGQRDDAMENTKGALQAFEVMSRANARNEETVRRLMVQCGGGR